MTKMNVPNAKKDISDIIIGQDLQVTVSSNRPKMINLSRIAKYLMHRFLMFWMELEHQLVPFYVVNVIKGSLC